MTCGSEYFFYQEPGLDLFFLNWSRSRNDSALQAVGFLSPRRGAFHEIYLNSNENMPRPAYFHGDTTAKVWHRREIVMILYLFGHNSVNVSFLLLRVFP